MLGIFLIICLAVYYFIEWKAYNLLKDDYIRPVVLDGNGQTYEVCHHAIVLYAISNLIMLLGYAGCAWPYLFIQGIDRGTYFFGIAMGLSPALAMAFGCYSNFRNAQGYIRISTDEIEYKRRKCFSVKVSDIKKITYWGVGTYQIHLKEKGKKPLQVSLNGFYKKKEICSLMEQLRAYCAEASGRERGFFHKLGWVLELIFARCFPSVVKAGIVLLLLYTSYCCIDYDFFKKDYTALFNALGAEPNQPENAWPYYVQAAVNYTKLEKNLQESLDCSKPDYENFTDDQIASLLKWFNENSSSWASLKEATSINYCNATYKRISLLLNRTDRCDFSSPSDTGYDQIRHLYSNANAGRLEGVIDLDWFDLFQMELASAKHFAGGKFIMDQLVGYAWLAKSIKLLAEDANYTPENLQKARTLLKQRFPAGLPPLSVEGEILMECSTFDDLLNYKNIPVQTPLNPVFLTLGSRSGTEAYARKHYKILLEQARKGVEVEPRHLFISFPIMRNLFFAILDGSVTRVYKASQRAGANLSAAYVVLDLEEYRLAKGRYPTDISQLREVGLISQLPDDPDSKGKIIYRNDGQRAILYAVGENGKDDGGYKDEKGSGKKRDDIIYWQRDLE